MKNINSNSIAVIGAQWGDEGKGKISDFLALNSDLVIRYQGGNNAGHTIEFKNKKFALRHIPSGIFNPNVINIMSQGMVINPKMLLDEINELKNKGINNFKLLISDRAHIILPYHLELDSKIEEIKSKNGRIIGTTKKGIGPAYEDKYARIGIRFGDFVDEKVFLEKLEETLLIKNFVLKGFEIKQYEPKEIFNEYKVYAKKLLPFVCETSSLINKKINENKKILFEGAQGVMLCIENGTYPYVTSSSPTASSIPLSTGLNTKCIQTVIGVVKAYTTRVGSGALPTEIQNQEINNYIRETGREYGTVTQRPRRIGWLDIVVLNHSIRVSGINLIALTLLDVLDELDEIKIGYEYKLDNKVIDYIPGSNDLYEKVEANYLSMPGWKKSIKNVSKFSDLPKEAQMYIKKIEELTKIKIGIFSVGPDREQTIYI